MVKETYPIKPKLEKDIIKKYKKILIDEEKTATEDVAEYIEKKVEKDGHKTI